MFDKVKIRVKTANVAEINEKQRPRTRASREVDDGAITITGVRQLPSGDGGGVVMVAMFGTRYRVLPRLFC